MKIAALYFLLMLPLVSFGQQLTTKFEQSKGAQTPTYPEIIDWWRQLDKQSAYVQMQAMGMTDAGYPLHLITVSADKDFNFESLRKKNKRIIFINNGIHPGEPDGIDATMLLVRDIAERWRYRDSIWGKGEVRMPVQKSVAGLPDNVVLAIIPVYNIGGCLNRSANYRVDQDGPEEFGFRGNSQNLDLNRDFIKCDTKEARAFVEIFHLLDPDVFIDNHVSNGADYQHVMTLLTSQHNKMGEELGGFMNNEFEPGIYKKMKAKGYDLIPYVNHFGDKPENGWPEFWDSPRYGSGYAALWQTFSFVPETHMLKPYDQRVKATYTLMESFIEYTSQNSEVIKKVRTAAREAAKAAVSFPIRWSLDRSRSQPFLYKGYASGSKASNVSGLPRLYYDRSRPYEKMIPLYNEYVPEETVQKTLAYIIPQGWWKVIDLLKLNKVKMEPLTRDVIIEVEVYHIDDYKTAARPYEMHHPNSDVKISSSIQKIRFREGDWYIPMNQAANHFLIQTLEPQAEDSYFAWNYFDGILGQKEGFSDYAFEDIAATWLQDNKDLQEKLAQRKAADSSFAQNARAQLNFVYQHSPYFEPAYLQYPVYRVIR